MENEVIMVDSIHSVAASAGHDPDILTAAQAKRGQNPVRGDAAKGAQSTANSVPAGDITEIVKELNILANRIASTKITFAVDTATGRTVVRVLDKETGEVIRQVPPQELLNLVAKLQTISGLIFSREV